MKPLATSVPDLIMKRARAGGRGSVFTPSDFLDVAARAAVDQALSRLARNGKLALRPAYADAALYGTAS